MGQTAQKKVTAAGLEADVSIALTCIAATACCAPCAYVHLNVDCHGSELWLLREPQHSDTLH